MSSEELVETIAEETGMDKDEIEKEVNDKVEEFSGMVSEEGALHLVAKEHGVELAEAEKNDLKVENIVPEMRKVNLKARVTNILDPNTFTRDDGEEGRVQNVILADETGTIRLTLWDEQTQIAEKVDVGDAIEVAGAYTVEDNRENAELRLGDDAQVKMADDDEVPEVESGPTEAEETDIRGIQSENANYVVRGMVMNVYTSNPFYRVDPETGNTVREDDDGNYATKDGKEVEEPESRLAVSAVLDDGTGNVRAVFFRQQARELLGIDEETEKDGDVRAVEEAAAEAVGTEIEVEGRTRYNDYFGQLEIIVNDLRDFDTDGQLEELLELMEA